MTLYLVSTPIGNPDDITLRALRILKEADVLVCEERKEGERLLARHAIKGKYLETLNEHNEAAASYQILAHLKAGRTVALVSDAGTPVFSDPGQTLVEEAASAGVRIVPVPGASSLLPALTSSGFAIDRFLFFGFPSPKTPRRKRELAFLRSERRAVVLMDTPYRLVALLKDVAEAVGAGRRVCVAFNMTLPDERMIRGSADEVHRECARLNLKGNFVLVVEGMREERARSDD
jgi:16S rRNA (cytidine1402-2'-O)-methyltransferase